MQIAAMLSSADRIAIVNMFNIGSIGTAIGACREFIPYAPVQAGIAGTQIKAFWAAPFLFRIAHLGGKSLSNPDPP